MNAANCLNLGTKSFSQDILRELVPVIQRYYDPNFNPKKKKDWEFLGNKIAIIQKTYPNAFAFFSGNTSNIDFRNTLNDFSGYRTQLKDPGDFQQRARASQKKAEVTIAKVGTKFNKNNNKGEDSKTLFIVEDSLQAQAHQAEQDVVEEIQDKNLQGKYTHIQGSAVEVDTHRRKLLLADTAQSENSAVMKTDGKGVAQPNVKGLVIKWDVYNPETGEFKNTPEDNISEEDFEMWRNLFLKQIESIKNALIEIDPKTKKKKYTRVMLPANFGTRAFLSQRVAEEIRTILKEELGITSDVQRQRVKISDKGNIVPVGQNEADSANPIYRYIVVFETEAKAQQKTKEKERKPKAKVRWAVLTDAGPNSINMDSESSMKEFLEGNAKFQEDTTIEITFPPIQEEGEEETVKFTFKQGTTVKEASEQILKSQTGEERFNNLLNKKNEKLGDQYFNQVYKILWQEWAKQNPESIKKLKSLLSIQEEEEQEEEAQQSRGVQAKVLQQPSKANYGYSEARALASIINDGFEYGALNVYEANQAEALHNVEQERPNPVELNSMDIEKFNILAHYYSDFQDQDAVSTYFLSQFRVFLTKLIEMAVQHASNPAIQKEMSSDRKVRIGFTYADRVRKLTSGSREEQRLWALEHLTADFLPEEFLEFYGLKKLAGTKAPLINIIFGMIKSELNDTINKIRWAQGDKNRIKDRLIDAFLLKRYKDGQGITQVGISTDSVIGRLFQDEVSAKNVAFGTQAFNNMLNNRAEQIYNLFLPFVNNTPETATNIFNAFIGNMAFEIELLENIRLNNFSAEGVGISTSQDEQDSEIDSENSSAVRGFDIINYKTLNPSKTLTTRIKALLSELDVTDSRGLPMFDRLGNRRKLSPYQAFYILCDEFSTMTSELEMDDILDNLERKYSWAYRLKKTLSSRSRNLDWDLRKEFYATMRITSTDFYMMSANGRLARLNRSATAEQMISTLRRTYSSGAIINQELSIYDGIGAADYDNINLILGFFNASQNTKDGANKRKYGKVLSAIDIVIKDKDIQSIVETPLQYVVDTFNSANSNKVTILDIVRALQVIRGEFDITPYLKDLDQEGIDNLEVLKKARIFKEIQNEDGSIKRVLNTNLTDLIGAFGIETTHFSFNDRVVNISAYLASALSVWQLGDADLIEQVKRGENFEEAVAILSGTKYLKDVRDNLTEKTKDQYRAVSSILNSMRKILEEGNKEGWPAGDFSNVQGSYLAIANALGIVDYEQTQAMFRHGDTTRSSYIAVDFIKNFENIVHKGREAALEFFIKKYGGTKFFEESDNWHNTWMDWMINGVSKEETGDSEISAEELCTNIFKTIEVLSIGGAEKKHTIGKVSRDDMRMALVKSYLQGAQVGTPLNEKHKNVGVGLYRNPLFSDVPALVLFRFLAYKGDNYQTEVVNKLAKVLIQELDRIRDIRKTQNKKVTIEFYNDEKANGEKLNYFPELESQKEEILDYYVSLLKIETSPERIAEKLGSSYLKEFMDEKAKAFIAQFSSAEKKELLRAEKAAAKKEAEREDQDVFADLKTEYNDEESTAKDKLSDEDVDKSTRLLSEFYYNDFLAQTQLMQIFGGDIAMYKNARDFIKRFKQAYTGGKRIYARDEAGRELFENAVYLEDLYETSASWQMIDTLLKRDDSMSDLQKAMLRGAVNTFHKITSTDGQSLRSLSSMKKIYEAMGGAWDDQMTLAFNRIREGKAQFEDLQVIFEHLKPFLVASEKVQTYQGKDGWNQRTDFVMTQHKNSEYALGVIYSAINHALNKSPELIALNEFMEAHNIDVWHFHSVVKEGYFGGVNINYNKTRLEEAIKNDELDNTETFKDLTESDDRYNAYLKYLQKQVSERRITQTEYNDKIKNLRHANKEEAIQDLESQLLENVQTVEGGQVVTRQVIQRNKLHTISLSEYMLVQPKSNHLVDHESLIGSQLQNIIPADLPKTFKMIIHLHNGDTVDLNDEQAVQHYNRLLVDMMLDAFQEIDSRVKTPKQLSEYLLAEMQKNSAQYDDSLKESIRLDEKGQFIMPFNNPVTFNKMNQLILGMFKKAIQKKYINGGTSILVSNYGLSDKLHIAWRKKGTTEVLTDEEAQKYGQDELEVAYIPALMPYNSMKMFEASLIKKVDTDGTEHYELDLDAFINNFEGKTKAEKRRKANKALEVIGYRIPTEDKYSIFPIRIVGFLPQEYGGAIILPTDIISMSGTDFDIDKLFMMIRTLIYGKTGKEFAGKLLEYIVKEKGLTEVEKPLQALLDPRSPGRWWEKVDTFDKAVQNANPDLRMLTKFITRFIDRRFSDEDLMELAMRDVDNMVRNFCDTEEGKAGLLFKPVITVDNPRVLYKRNEDGSIVQEEYLDEKGVTRVRNAVDLDEMSRRATPQQRNNMFIDMVQGFLTTNEVAKLMFIPGSYPTVKKSSRINRIFSDKKALEKAHDLYKDAIKEIGSNSTFWEWLKLQETDFLENLYDEYAEKQNPAGISEWLDNFRNLMDGNDLIGMLAVNSSNHYKYQFLNLNLLKPYQFDFVRHSGNNQTGKVHIDRIDDQTSAITGIRIGRACAELQAASPDNGKDPCLGDLGITSNNIARIELLVRLGFGIEDLGFINVLDDLVEAAKDLVKSRSDSQTKRVLTEWASLTDFALDVSKIADLALKVRTEGAKNLDAEEQKLLLQFASWREQMDKAAKDLELANEVSRSDSQNGALPVDAAEVIQKMLKIRKLREAMARPTFAITGLEELVPFDLNLDTISKETRQWKEEARQSLMKTKIPRLSASYVLGISEAVKLSSQYLEFLRPEVFQLFEELRYFSQKDLTYKSDVATIKTFIQELTAFMTSNSKIFGGSAEQITADHLYYVSYFPQKFRKLRKEHPEIEDLKIVKILRSPNREPITSTIVSRITQDLRHQYQQELDTLIRSDEKWKNDLAMDLFKYSFHINGLNFGHNAFNIYFTPEYVYRMNSYIEDLKKANGEYNLLANSTTGELNPLGFQYLLQFLINNPRLIPTVSNKRRERAKVNIERSKTDPTIITIRKRKTSQNTQYSTLPTEMKISEEEYRSGHSPLIIYKSSKSRDSFSIYALTSDSDNLTEPQYQELCQISKGKPKFYNREANALSDIDWDNTPNYGVSIDLKYYKNNKDMNDIDINEQEGGEPREVEAPEVNPNEQEGFDVSAIQKDDTERLAADMPEDPLLPSNPNLEETEEGVDTQEEEGVLAYLGSRGQIEESEREGIDREVQEDQNEQDVKEEKLDDLPNNSDPQDVIC